MTLTIQRNFQSETLVVDWISFKFQQFEPSSQTQVATYLFTLGFHSYQQSGKLAKPIKEPLLVSPIHTLEVTFVGDNSYWQGTLLHLSGVNAKAFYDLAHQQVIDWSIFSLSVLSRFDLYYSRTPKRTDKISVNDFLQDCHSKLKQTPTNASFDKNSKGILLTIGSRRSNHYSRIYQAINSLRFEYEMKGKFLHTYHSLLVTNQFEEFEDALSNRFLRYFAKVLPLSYPQVDWLVIQLRPIRKQHIPIVDKLALNSHSIEVKDSVDHQQFIHFLQFLKYAKHLDFNRDTLGDISYREVVFQVHDFLDFLRKSSNYYQLKKMKTFLEELQENFFLTSFSDNHFQRLVTIPQVTFERSHTNSWIAKVWVVEELFSYDYPFLLPNFFLGETNKHKFEVQFKMIQVFSSVDIEKVFDIQTFLQEYPSVLSNQYKTRIKQYFLEVVQILEDYDLIEGHYKIISKGKFYSTSKLTTTNISEGFIIYEKLSL